MTRKKLIKINSSQFQSLFKAIYSFFKSFGKYHQSQWQKEQVIDLKPIKTERIVSTESPNECSKCGHGPLSEILYGMPDFKDPEFQRAYSAGEITCGECCITGMEAKWQFQARE